MQEPFHDEIAGATRGQRLSDTYKEVRERALKLPKFGTSAGAENKDVQEITRLAVLEVSRRKNVNCPSKSFIVDKNTLFSILHISIRSDKILFF